MKYIVLQCIESPVAHTCCRADQLATYIVYARAAGCTQQANVV